MIFAFGDCEVDDASYELRIRGSAVTIQRKLLDVLLYLLKNRDRAVLKEELLRGVWNGVHVTENALAQAISSLRATFLGHHVPDPVATVRGRGYRFACVVEERRSERPTLKDRDRLAVMLHGALTGLHGGLVIGVDDVESLSGALELLPEATVLRSRAPETGAPFSAWRAFGDESAFVLESSSRQPPVGVVDVLVDSLRRACTRDPVVIVLERLDLADPASVLLFLHLMRRPRSNLAVVATVDLDALAYGGEVAQMLRQLAWRPSTQGAQSDGPASGITLHGDPLADEEPDEAVRS